jgi:hypothetical protein
MKGASLVKVFWDLGLRYMFSPVGKWRTSFSGGSELFLHQQSVSIKFQWEFWMFEMILNNDEKWNSYLTFLSLNRVSEHEYLLEITTHCAHLNKLFKIIGIKAEKAETVLI